MRPNSSALRLHVYTQYRHNIRRSLDDDSAATLVHALVAIAGSITVAASWMIEAPKKTIDKLQRVLNAAARIVSNTRKHDRGLRQFRRRELHWLQTSTTGFGSECVSRCTSVYTTWHLDTCRHSANPCPAFLVAVTYAWMVVANWTSTVWTSTYGGRAFVYAGPILELAAWRSQEH